MKGAVRFVVIGALAAILLLLADTILQPVPIPAGTALLGGVLALWFRPSGIWVVVGWVAGGLAGAGIHVSAHLGGRSTIPEAGLTTHVTLDVLGGLAVAGAILVTLAIAARLPWWTERTTSAHDAGEWPADTPQ